MCSTYYSFCGNAAATLVGGGKAAAGNSSAIGEGLRGAVCRKWLHPIGMREHPAFSSWVIYGAAAVHVPAHGLAGAGVQWWLREGVDFMQCRLQVRMLLGCACRLYVSHSQLHSNVCKSGVSATVKWEPAVQEPPCLSTPSSDQPYAFILGPFPPYLALRSRWIRHFSLRVWHGAPYLRAQSGNGVPKPC